MPSGPRKIELLLRFLRAQNLWNRRRQAKAGVRALQTRLAAPQPGLARVHICLNRTVTAERLQTRTASALVAQAARFCSGPDQADPRPHDPAGQSRRAGMGATAPRIKLTRIGSDTDLSGATRTGCTDGASRQRDRRAGRALGYRLAVCVCVCARTRAHGNVCAQVLGRARFRRCVSPKPHRRRPLRLAWPLG